MTFDWSKAKLARKHVEPDPPEKRLPRRRFDIPADAPTAKCVSGPTLWDFIEAYMPAARQLALSQPQNPTVAPHAVDTSHGLKL